MLMILPELLMMVMVCSRGMLTRTRPAAQASSSFEPEQLSLMRTNNSVEAKIKSCTTLV